MAFKDVEKRKTLLFNRKKDKKKFKMVYRFCSRMNPVRIHSIEIMESSIDIIIFR